MFGPNVAGTAELIRIALTTKLKPFTYVSTADVGAAIEPSAFTEDADIRVISPTRTVDGGWAGGYGTSKWAGEVLLREANDLCALPVAVFRCGMILADTSYAGQLNMSDWVTRMVLSLMATGIAPRSFYEPDSEGNRQRAHFDGLPVTFVAEAIAVLGARVAGSSLAGFATYHVMNPHDDGIGLDEYVDWLIEAGYPIRRIDDFAEWLQRFEASLGALPDRQRRHSVLPMLLASNSQRLQPLKPTRGAPRRPTDSVPRCERRKSAPTRTIQTSRTCRRRPSSTTSPTYNCSDCCSCSAIKSAAMVGEIMWSLSGRHRFCEQNMWLMATRPVPGNWRFPADEHRPRRAAVSSRNGDARGYQECDVGCANAPVELHGDGTAGNWPAGCVRGGRGLRAGVGSAPLR